MLNLGLAPQDTTEDSLFYMPPPNLRELKRRKQQALTEKLSSASKELSNTQTVYWKIGIQYTNINTHNDSNTHNDLF